MSFKIRCHISSLSSLPRSCSHLNLVESREGNSIACISLYKCLLFYLYYKDTSPKCNLYCSWGSQISQNEEDCSHAIVYQKTWMPPLQKVLKECQAFFTIVLSLYPSEKGQKSGYWLKEVFLGKRIQCFLNWSNTLIQFLTTRLKTLRLVSIGSGQLMMAERWVNEQNDNYILIHKGPLFQKLGPNRPN